MIGEKIGELRRKNNMSQEELADRLGISRQSVSKWESGQSLPDIEKLPLLSDIFHVSIDYLVKEDTVPVIEPEPVDPEEETEDEPETAGSPFQDDRLRAWKESVQKTFFSARAETEDPEQYILREEEAEEFLALRAQKGDLVSKGTALCVSSLIPVIFLATLGTEVPFLDEEVGGALGTGIMFAMIAYAVTRFMNSGRLGKQYEFLDKTIITPEYKAERVIDSACPALIERSQKNVTIGVALCILSVTPFLIGAALTSMTDFIGGVCACLMFGMIAAAVYLFVQAGYADGTAKRLMQEGEFKVEAKKHFSFKSIYWAIITAVYVVYSAVTSSWHISWVIWVLASIAYPFISGDKSDFD